MSSGRLLFSAFFFKQKTAYEMNFMFTYFPPPAAHRPHECIACAILSGNTCLALPPSLAQVALALSLSPARARSDETESSRRAIDCPLSPQAGRGGLSTGSDL